MWAPLGEGIRKGQSIFDWPATLYDSGDLMKIDLITHGDADGVCAAAIILKKFGTNRRIWFSQPFSLNKTLSKVRKPNVLFILDIAVDRQNFEKVQNRLFDLRKQGTLVIWMDHHETSEEYKDKLFKCTDMCWIDLTKSASQIVNDVFGGGNELAILGAASDKVITNKNAASMAGTIGAAMSANPRDDKYRAWLTKRLSKGLEGLEEEIADKAEEAKKKLEELLDKGEVIFDGRKLMIKRYGNEAFGSASAISGELASQHEKVIIIFSTVPWSPGLLVISSRQPYYKRAWKNLAEIMGNTEKYGGSGGGHKKAAGGRIPEEKFDEFVKYLKTEFK